MISTQLESLESALKDSLIIWRSFNSFWQTITELSRIQCLLLQVSHFFKENNNQTVWNFTFCFNAIGKATTIFTLTGKFCFFLTVEGSKSISRYVPQGSNSRGVQIRWGTSNFPFLASWSAKDCQPLGQGRTVYMGTNINKKNSIFPR